MEKKLCPIHHYFYTGNECPICTQERLQKMALHCMGIPKERLVKKNDNYKFMDEMLNKLKEKYNKR